MPALREWIEFAAQGIEALAVAIMVAFIIVATTRWLTHRTGAIVDGYERFRRNVGKSILVGLELLVAADIIRTVALDTTLANLTTLAILVAIRTALGWTLAVEIDGRWPWQADKAGVEDTAKAEP